MESANAAMIKYEKNQKIEQLKNVEKNLINAEVLNNKNANIKWNLAYIYEKEGNIKKSITKWEEVLTYLDKYFETYKIYCELLESQYKKTGEKYYKDKIEDLKEKYNISYNDLNKNAIYLKNQLPRKFEEIRNKIRR